MNDFKPYWLWLKRGKGTAEICGKFYKNYKKNLECSKRRNIINLYSIALYVLYSNPKSGYGMIFRIKRIFCIYRALCLSWPWIFIFKNKFFVKDLIHKIIILIYLKNSKFRPKPISALEIKYCKRQNKV